MSISKEEIEQKLVLDHSRDDLLTFFGKKTLQDRYCQPGEGPQHVFGRASLAFCGDDLALAQRLYDYASKLWLSFATPLIANGGAANNGLPISCFLNYVADSIPGLIENFAENAHLSTKGGGIGTFWGAVRSVGEKNSEGVETPGLMPFLHVVDSQVLAYHQGTTRRGSAASYIRIDHPEIVSFIEMRQPTGGDVHRKNLNLHHGVCLTDKFMFAVKADLMWDLLSPKTGEKKGEVKARELWQRILTQRVKTGEPYIFFEDTANRALPLSQKLKHLYINHSNLCTEIMLATGPDRTAVCCLSSINVAKRREWRPVVKQFLLDIATMLDNVLDIFIRDAPKAMWRAINSAVNERAIGIGTLGFHTYLQQEDVAIEHEDATKLNDEIYAELNLHGEAANLQLGAERGECPDMEGTGKRFSHVFAIAPNASSSIICGGVSPSIEPILANAFTQKTLSGSHLVKNPALVPVLERYGRNDEETWTDIIVNRGSVQHLDFLTLWEKAVFKTAIEIDQMVLIDLAAQRQRFICQGQSVNLFMPADVSAQVLNKVHFAAWAKGLKSLYYLRSEAVKATEVVSKKVERIQRVEAPVGNAIDPAAESDCLACEA